MYESRHYRKRYSLVNKRCRLHQRNHHTDDIGPQTISHYYFGLYTIKILLNKENNDTIAKILWSKSAKTNL